MNQKTIGTLLAALMLTLTAIVGVAAPAAAATTTTTDTVDTAPLNETVSVTDDTRSLLVSASNSSAVLDGHVYSIVNGSETLVANSTIDATLNTTGTWEWSLPADQADQYRVLVNGSSVESVDLYTIEKNAVGGGGLMPSDGSVPLKTVGLGLGGLLAVLGAISYYSDGRML